MDSNKRTLRINLPNANNSIPLVTMNTSSHRHNNFDLIRLFAALQVMLLHMIYHLKLDATTIHPALAYLGMFPGVPIFYMLSGFLIFASYERSSSILDFAYRRFLRVYPGLWVSLVVSLLILAALGYINKDNISTPAIWQWFFGAATIVQFYDHTFFANWANKGVNGALWTITIELQFYIFVPLLVEGLRRLPGNRKIWLIILTVIALCVNMTTNKLDPYAFTTKLFKVTLAPYLFWFCLGILAHVFHAPLTKLISGRLIWVLLIYLTYVTITSLVNNTYGAKYFLNLWGLGGALLLFFVVFSAAYTAPRTAWIFLRGNDISYGIYIYHMLVFGAFVEAGITGQWSYAIIVVPLTLLLGTISWISVERPILLLKRNHIKRNNGYC